MKRPLFVAAAFALAACNSMTSLPRMVPNPSLVKPNSASSDLVYVTTTPGEVRVYAYSSGRLVMELHGLKLPKGECVDASGNVFITDEVQRKIFKYAHGGRKPIAVLGDPGRPLDCSVDPSTGNLAVANVLDRDEPGAPGDLQIYAGAKGRPTRYAIRVVKKFFFCAYDGSGNLFASGVNWSNVATFAELRKGGTRMHVTHIQGVSRPAGLKWDGHYLDVGAFVRGYDSHTIYRTTAGKIVSKLSVRYGNAEGYFAIAPGRIVLLDDLAAGGVGIWKYPAGGNPLLKIDVHLDTVAVAISPP